LQKKSKVIYLISIWFRVKQKSAGEMAEDDHGTSGCVWKEDFAIAFQV
jgi:hypothetical protein